MQPFRMKYGVMCHNGNNENNEYYCVSENTRENQGHQATFCEFIMGERLANWL